MDVSIIIVNYHTEVLIRDALVSIEEKTSGVDCEIIIVDNDPTDTSRALLGSIKCGMPLKYLAMTENKGFGMANNEGFRHASGKYYFCLNPDTLLVNNAIGILFDYIDSHPRCGACGGNLFHEDMSRAISFRRILPGVLWEFSESVKRHPERLLFGRNTRFNHTGHPLKVGYISGADLMLRADLIKGIGGFAPEFFMYFEETDLCARIRRAGFDVVSVPQARIIHLEGKSMGLEEVNHKKLKYYSRSKVEYYRRNLPLEKAAKAYGFHLRALRKRAAGNGGGAESARAQLEHTLWALDTYPELKNLLPEEFFIDLNKQTTI